MRPRIGLALGSGSARGLSHIGVLKVLEHYKIPIHHIAGTSIGSVIGAIYASGTSCSEMEDFAKRISLKKYMSYIDLKINRDGLIQGEKIKNIFRELLKVGLFSGLKIPLSIVTTDLFRGKEHIIESGDLVSAIRASISIPGIFCSVKEEGKVLVDGGLINPLPIDVLLRKGCDVVIAVDLTYTPGKVGKNPKIYEMIVGSVFLMQSEISRYRQIILPGKRTIIIRPGIDDTHLFDFTKPGEIIKKGELAALENIPQILELTRPRLHERLGNWLKG